MHYVIFPDTLFLENLICDLCFLSFMKMLFFPDATGKRIFSAAVVGALGNTIVSVLFFRCALFFRLTSLIPAAGVMIVLGLPALEPRRTLFLLYQMILWTLAFGGILQWLQQWHRSAAAPVIASAVLLPVVFLPGAKLFAYYKRQNECMREIILCFHGNEVRFRAFADTGNQLVDPLTHKPVSVITREAWDTLTEKLPLTDCYPVPYRCVGSPAGTLPGMSIDRMIVLRGKDSRVIEKPMIAVTPQPFTGIFHYSVLLHNQYC